MKLLLIKLTRLCIYSSVDHFLKEESASRANQNVRNIRGFCCSLFMIKSILSARSCFLFLVPSTQTGRVVIKVLTVGNYEEVCINRQRALRKTSDSFSVPVIYLLQYNFTASQLTYTHNCAFSHVASILL